MTGYAWLMARLPKRWALPATQVGMAVMLLLFWFLFHASGTGSRSPFTWRVSSSAFC